MTPPSLPQDPVAMKAMCGVGWVTVRGERPPFTQLINAVDKMVYLDVEQPRICIRGPEVHDDDKLGYAWSAFFIHFP